MEGVPCELLHSCTAPRLRRETMAVPQSASERACVHRAPGSGGVLAGQLRASRVPPPAGHQCMTPHGTALFVVVLVFLCFFFFLAPTLTDRPDGPPPQHARCSTSPATQDGGGVGSARRAPSLAAHVPAAPPLPPRPRASSALPVCHCAVLPLLTSTAALRMVWSHVLPRAGWRSFIVVAIISPYLFCFVFLFGTVLTQGPRAVAASLRCSRPTHLASTPSSTLLPLPR
jgi:hypothetical protein